MRKHHVKRRRMCAAEWRNVRDINRQFLDAGYTYAAARQSEVSVVRARSLSFINANITSVIRALNEMTWVWSDRSAERLWLRYVSYLAPSSFIIRRAIPPLWSATNSATQCHILHRRRPSVSQIWIIYALFSQPVVGFWGSDPRPHLGSVPGPRWGTFVPIPLICPPLENILRAPMSRSYHDVTRTAIMKHPNCAVLAVTEETSEITQWRPHRVLPIKWASPLATANSSIFRRIFINFTYMVSRQGWRGCCDERMHCTLHFSLTPAVVVVT